ncbi:MAG: c-type cytochrome domain-containing protein [Pirellulales bacterium]
MAWMIFVRPRGIGVGLVLFWFAAVAAAENRGAADDANKRVDYARDIKPLLAQNCVRCHGPKKQKSDLRVDSGKGLLAGGKIGPAVIAGKGEKSPLVQAILGTSNDIVAMPPTGEGEPLSDEQAALVRRWIDEGAKFPAGE